MSTTPPTPIAGPARADRTGSLRRDRRGATAIEFALVALPLMALLIAVLEVTTTFFAQQVLETAAERGARLLMTGTVQKNNMTAADFKNKVCTYLPGFLKCARLVIDVDVATDFSLADTTAPAVTLDANGNPTGTRTFRLGSPGEIVIMKAMYVWDVQAGPLGFDLSTLSRGKRLLMTTSVFKAEQY
jgi:Flp pilus assembly protein TadG